MTNPRIQGDPFMGVPWFLTFIFVTSYPIDLYFKNFPFEKRAMDSLTIAVGSNKI